MLRPLLLVLALSVSAMTGCATIVSGTTQTITFNSSPPGAEVKIDGAVVGVTPVTTEVSRKARGVVEISKEGHKPQHMQLSKKLNPMFFGNFLAGGSFGSTTDGTSGAIHEYKQDAFYATLESSRLADPALASGTDRTNAVRTFVLVNFTSLRREAASGGGEFVQALNTLTFARDSKVYSTSDLQSVFNACDGPVTCAEIFAGDRPLKPVASKPVAQATKTKRGR